MIFDHHTTDPYSITALIIVKYLGLMDHLRRQSPDFGGRFTEFLADCCSGALASITSVMFRE